MSILQSPFALGALDELPAASKRCSRSMQPLRFESLRTDWGFPPGTRHAVGLAVAVAVLLLRGHVAVRVDGEPEVGPAVAVLVLRGLLAAAFGRSARCSKMPSKSSSCSVRGACRRHELDHVGLAVAVAVRSTRTSSLPSRWSSSRAGRRRPRPPRCARASRRGRSCVTTSGWPSPFRSSSWEAASRPRTRPPPRACRRRSRPAPSAPAGRSRSASRARSGRRRPCRPRRERARRRRAPAEVDAGRRSGRSPRAGPCPRRRRRRARRAGRRGSCRAPGAPAGRPRRRGASRSGRRSRCPAPGRDLPFGERVTTSGLPSPLVSRSSPTFWPPS